MDRTSLPGPSGALDSALTWTKTVYDRAGRAIKTLAHDDISGAAGLAVASFERGYGDTTIDGDGIAERWDAATDTFITAGATLHRDGGTTTSTGAYRLRVTLGTGANTGVQWYLDGTFKGGHTYKARVWVSPGSQTITGKLGTLASSGSATVSGTGWQPLDLTWTPGSDQTGVRLALFRAATGSAVDVLVDNAMVWDNATPDVNIPTETAYDADGHVIASVVAPGTVGTIEQPMVTLTSYDAVGRVTGVTVNAITGAGTSAPDVNLATLTHYDALGRADTTTDPTGTVTRYAYDRLGRLTSTIDNYQDGLTTSPTDEFTDSDVKSTFAYDGAGQLIGYCPAAQVYVGGCDAGWSGEPQAWHYGYDLAGHVATQTPPVNTTAQVLASTRWEYDAGGRLVTTCDTTAPASTCAAGGASVVRTITPSYDAVGRTTRTDTYAGAATTLALRTDTTYLGDGQPKQVKYSEGATPTVVDTIDFQYDTLGRQTKVLRGATTLSEASYNADGTLGWRKDGDGGTLGQSNYGYDWAKRLTSVQVPSTFATATTATFGWRLDGLANSRTWATGAAATFAYDAAKRPTGLTKGALTEAQTYDRDGNVVSEARGFTGITGDAGSGTQTFTYDALNRVTASSGLSTSANRTYTYDRDGNRKTKTEGGVSFSYAYDLTDELLSVQKAGNATQFFAYDSRGNMTTDAQTGVALTLYTYDLGNKLKGIDGTGTANDATFTFDALGRFASRVLAVGSGTDAYSYAGTGETVVRIANLVAGTTDSIVSPQGDRLGVKAGSVTNWFLPDLHGDIAGSLDAAETTVTNAIRYDPYGQTITTGTAGGTRIGDKAWTYQGRLDISPQGLGTPLLDMAARFYAPGIGAFTQADTSSGKAQNPASMNRFLCVEQGRSLQ